MKKNIIYFILIITIFTTMMYFLFTTKDVLKMINSDQNINRGIVKCEKYDGASVRDCEL